MKKLNHIYVKIAPIKKKKHDKKTNMQANVANAKLWCHH